MAILLPGKHTQIINRQRWISLYLSIFFGLSMAIFMSMGVNAANSPKLAKLKLVVKKQQDTIDLLNLKLKQCGQTGMYSSISYVQASQTTPASQVTENNTTMVVPKNTTVISPASINTIYKPRINRNYSYP